MSRQTVTITAPNGARVRTVASRAFFVVRYGLETTRYVPPADPLEVRGTFETLDPPVPYATVVKRTDNLDTAKATARKTGGAAVVVALRYQDGKPLAVELARYGVRTVA